MPDKMILVNGSPNDKKAVLISQGRQGLPGAGVPSGTSNGDVLQFFSGAWVGQPLNAMTVRFNGAQAATLGTNVSSALDYLATQGAAYLTAIGNNATDIALLTAADSLVDNGDGTYGHRDNAGNVVTIDTNGATAAYVFGGTGTYTIGSPNVDAAIQALDTGLTALGSPDGLVDNGDGTFSHTANDDTVTNVNFLHSVVDNGNGTYTFSDPIGGLSVINTNANSNPYAHSGAGTITPTAPNVAVALQSLDAALTNVQSIVNGPDVFVDNGDGTLQHTAVDGTVTTFDANSTLVDNTNGTYTHTSAGGVITSINTNANSNPYAHSGAGTITPGATNVAVAIQLLDAAVSGIQPDTLVDNGDGTLTHTSNAGVPVTFNAGWTQVTQSPTTGVITVAYPDGTTVNVQGLPSTPASSATPVPGQITVADGTNAAYSAGVLMFG